MSKAKPTASQLEFLEWELGVFLHFGIRTFYEDNRDWDMKFMDAKNFNPTELDCEKWADDILSTGAKYAVMTTKHHDGFALWPSECTEYSVKNSVWKDGKGDVVREYTDAMRKKGIKVGLYYSCSQFDAKEQGEDYGDFVMKQIRELLTNYGKIDIIWFDGNGSVGDKCSPDDIKELIFSLQPDIKVFGCWGNTTRWIGNEWGLAPMQNSNVITKMERDLSREADVMEEATFIPGECDCCMVRNFSENFWFYTETYKDCLRTKEEIVGMYYYSIGRGANLLFNLAPDRRGLLQESNVELLKYMSDEMHRREFDCKLEYKSLEKIDNEYKIVFDRNYIIDHVFLEEDLTEGQNIKEFTIYINPHDTSVRIGVYKGFTVGHKAICSFPPVRAKQVFIVPEDADEGAKLKNISVSYVSGSEQIVQI